MSRERERARDTERAREREREIQREGARVLGEVPGAECGASWVLWGMVGWAKRW